MSRSAPVVPAVLLACALTLSACTGGGAKSGSSGLRDPYFPKMGNGGYDVTHYGLTLDYDPGSDPDDNPDDNTDDNPDGDRLRGTAVITARATQDLGAFDLDLKGLHVKGVTVEGKDARWERSGQELTVHPKRDLAKGETFRTTVRYSGSPETITDPDGSEEGWLRTGDGALALGEPTGSMAWFPGNHHPSDKATYDIEITVPEGLRAVSNGELKNESTRKGRTTFSWHTAEPMASYVTTVAIGTYETRATRTKTDLPVYVAVDPSQSEASREVLAQIPEIMTWAEDTFGRYPFSSTGAIVDREGDAEYALETQNRPVFPGPPDTETLVHELAHQWYGNSVTPATWRDMWLNEGFATYAEWLWQEEHDGQSAQEIFDALYEGDHYPDATDDKDIWSFPPAEPSGPGTISDSPVYERGAMVLHKIRQKVGDDTFRALLRGWAAEHRHGNADTGEFTAYVEKLAPDEDFGEIWEDWLYGDGKPAKP
ncbi:M1 family metallopeptidase [Streptomyces spongiae]|uniref:Aminopeptidase N n=1 Tax=Streptomyces spongiae TaxID=565072 RepID=A0A5N8XKC6_9ACTN|nr:M1 family metallopeptidase [Streptomyces spongiae]MPY59909.1 M1 family metallopeptidase [Streptomyces spongiae]